MAVTPMFWTDVPDGDSTSLPLAIAPAETSATASQVVQFSVTGAAPGDVTWSITPDSQGAFHDGVFVAPQQVNTTQVLTVTATAADGRSARAALRLTAVTVSISPDKVQLRSDEIQQFVAFAMGDPANGIAWTITPGVGTIANGLYTGPHGQFEAEEVNVTAISTLDPTKYATAGIRFLKPKPMPQGLTRFFGLSLMVFCLAISGGVIAFWPIAHARARLDGIAARCDPLRNRRRRAL